MCSLVYGGIFWFRASRWAGDLISGRSGFVRPGGSVRGSTVACAMYDWVCAGLGSRVGERDLISL